MTASRSSLLGPMLLGAALALSACSGGPRDVATASSAAPTPSGEIDEIAALLDRGKAQAARRRIKDALEDDPMNPSLMMLLQAIDGDAREALGPVSYPYTVQPGETIAGLAERFLGNRLKAYQLARYNAIVTPGDVRAGTRLLIPGRPPGAAPEPAPRSEPARAAAPTSDRDRERTTATVARPRPEPARRAPADPAAARRARTAGLTALNQGKVSQALALLRRAAALDPGNDAIAADLARAQRIARTVRSRR